jgi:hypothetical protein
MVGFIVEFREVIYRRSQRLIINKRSPKNHDSQESRSPLSPSSPKNDRHLQNDCLSSSQKAIAKLKEIKLYKDLLEWR